MKGTYESPTSTPFPVPYSDNFDGQWKLSSTYLNQSNKLSWVDSITDYAEFSEADYFADQAGVYEIRTSKNRSLGKVMMQVGLLYAKMLSNDKGSCQIAEHALWTIPSYQNALLS